MPADQNPSKLVAINVDRDGWTQGLQLNLVTLDENGSGMGYRLAGPKYNGSSKNLLRAELDERDATEIRKALDAVFPLPDAGPVHELTPDEQQFLRFALELAADQMAVHGDEFDATNDAALESLRRLAGEAAPDPAPDFYRPGYTYSDTAPEWRFRCDTVTTHPEDGERTALGWRFFRGEWDAIAYGEDDWDLCKFDGRAATGVPRG